MPVASGFNFSIALLFIRLVMSKGGYGKAYLADCGQDWETEVLAILSWRDAADDIGSPCDGFFRVGCCLVVLASPYIVGPS